MTLYKQSDKYPFLNIFLEELRMVRKSVVSSLKAKVPAIQERGVLHVQCDMELYNLVHEETMVHKKTLEFLIHVISRYNN